MPRDKISHAILVFLLAFLFNSCFEKKEEKTHLDTFIKGFSLSHIKNGEKKWEIFCNSSWMNQKQDELKCYDSHILVYSDGKKISDIKSKTGYGELSKESFYLKDDVRVISYSQEAEVYCDKLYFDSKREIIYSDVRTRIIRKKEGVEIDSQGFEAKSDLSNIRFFKHTTKKI